MLRTRKLLNPVLPIFPDLFFEFFFLLLDRFLDHLRDIVPASLCNFRILLLVRCVFTAFVLEILLPAFLDQAFLLAMEALFLIANNWALVSLFQSVSQFFLALGLVLLHSISGPFGWSNEAGGFLLSLLHVGLIERFSLFGVDLPGSLRAEKSFIEFEHLEGPNGASRRLVGLFDGASCLLHEKAFLVVGLGDFFPVFELLGVEFIHGFTRFFV